MYNKEYIIPFTNDNLLVEIELDGDWLEISVRERYEVSKECQLILGITDSRPVVIFGFRLPTI